MKKRKFFAAIGTAVLIGASGVASFAADKVSNNVESAGKIEVRNELRTEMSAKIKEYLSQALKDGKITQEQYDKMIKMSFNGKQGRYGKNRKKGQEYKRTPLTEEQKAEMKKKREEMLTKDLKDGKITQDQFDMMKNKASQGRKRGFAGNKMVGIQLTDKQKAELKAIREKILNDSLKAGKITQDEYDKMMSRTIDGDSNTNSDTDSNNSVSNKVSEKKAAS